MPKPFLNLPHGLEVLIIKAAVDPEFKALLLDHRAGAAAAIGLTLTPTESAMLAAIPAETLEATIAQTQVLPETRRVFLGKVAAAMLAALGVGSGSALQPWAMTCLGIDVPSPLVGKDDYGVTTQTQFVVLNENDLNAALAENDMTSQTANATTSQTRHTLAAPPQPARPEIESIFFERGTATIRADQRPRLKRNLEILKNTLKGDQRVLVISHTDASGAPEINRALCERRAATIRAALLRGGIPARQIKTETQLAFKTKHRDPAEPKQIEADAAWDRRVDFLILNPVNDRGEVKDRYVEVNENGMIDLRTLVNFPKPIFTGGHSPYIPPDTLRDGWDMSPNSKR